MYLDIHITGYLQIQPNPSYWDLEIRNFMDLQKVESKQNHYKTKLTGDLEDVPKHPFGQYLGICIPIHPMNMVTKHS